MPGCVELHATHAADDRNAYLVNKHTLLVGVGYGLHVEGLAMGLGTGVCVSGVVWGGGSVMCGIAKP